jgi:MFS superfamily sulfate permease-like transporter
MLVKALFVIVLILMSSLSFFVDLPPGNIVTAEMDISSTLLSFFTYNLLNGIVFGTVIAVIVFLIRRKTKRKTSRYQYQLTSSKSSSNEMDKLLGNYETSVESNLTEINGIGPKRAFDLKIAGVTTIHDLAKRSPKHLAEKTGIPITQISKWIIEANKLIK